MDRSLPNKEQLLNQHLINGDHDGVIELCEEIISLDSTTKSNYWYLGLALLLQDNETDAQLAWAMGFADTSPQDEQIHISELTAILELESDRLVNLSPSSLQKAWIIRRHLHEIAPNYLLNLLRLTQLSIQLDYLTNDDQTLIHLVPYWNLVKKI